MKAVILAGGLGTRLSEETGIRPKPMVEIGGMPILWHIMKTYSAHGIDEFIICLGYKGHLIKQFFADYALRRADITVDLATREIHYRHQGCEPWQVHLIDTGDASMTGGRLRRIHHLLGEESFCMTYGDGLTDADIGAEIAFHQRHQRKATLLAVQPAGRFGAFELHADDLHVPAFHEKPAGDGAWISGGYFILDPVVIDYIEDDATVWEREPMERLAREGELLAFRHSGFWQPMDTLRDRQYLESLWAGNSAPWRCWDDGPAPMDRRGERVRA